jgi:hypothetical protein
MGTATLQALECISISGFLFDLLKLLELSFTELKLSFCHRPILHQESSFSFIHKAHRGSDANEARCQGSDLKRYLRAISNNMKPANALKAMEKRGKLELFGPHWRLSRWAKANENQRVMHELCAAQTLRGSQSIIGGPLEKSALGLSWINVAVRCTVCQHMPDDHQDFAHDEG